MHIILIFTPPGERILEGSSKLCLTTNCLQLLNGSFSSIRGTDLTSSFEVLPGNSPCMPLCQDIQFLYDFMQKTPALKVLGVIMFID